MSSPPRPHSSSPRGAAGFLLKESAVERETLILLSQGLSNAEIATELWVTERTVKTHVYRTFTKLGCDNRVKAAMLAQRAGLLAEHDS